MQGSVAPAGEQTTTKEETMELQKTIEGMIETLNTALVDAKKFVGGNNSAGTRVRKAMQDVKVSAQHVRETVQEMKNA